MRRIAVMVFVLVTVSGPSRAQSTSIFGIGTASCATWLSDSQMQMLGASWILGLWSGMNYAGSKHRVGHTTDAQGLVGEVKKRCLDVPSDLLLEASVLTFKEFERDGR